MEFSKRKSREEPNERRPAKVPRLPELFALEVFPMEIWAMLVSFLDHKDAVSLAAVCKDLLLTVAQFKKGNMSLVLRGKPLPEGMVGMGWAHIIVRGRGAPDGADLLPPGLVLEPSSTASFADEEAAAWLMRNIGRIPPELVVVKFEFKNELPRDPPFLEGGMVGEDGKVFMRPVPENNRLATENEKALYLNPILVWGNERPDLFSVNTSVSIIHITDTKVPWTFLAALSHFFPSLGILKMVRAEIAWAWVDVRNLRYKMGNHLVVQPTHLPLVIVKECEFFVTERPRTCDPVIVHRGRNMLFSLGCSGHEMFFATLIYESGKYGCWQQMFPTASGLKAKWIEAVGLDEFGASFRDEPNYYPYCEGRDPATLKPLLLL